LLGRMGDIDDLAEKMLMAGGDPALRSYIGSRARESVERRHNIDDAVERYLDVLEKLVTEGRARDRVVFRK
jgi:glycosyltransferase involved in cell wall biosynthesis